MLAGHYKFRISESISTINPVPKSLNELGIVLPLALILLALLPLLLYQGRLPDPMATQWGTDGSASNSTPFTLLVLLTMTFTGVPAGAMLHSGLKHSVFPAGVLRSFQLAG
jgi:hypothetical protein